MWHKRGMRTGVFYNEAMVTPFFDLCSLFRAIKQSNERFLR